MTGEEGRGFALKPSPDPLSEEEGERNIERLAALEQEGFPDSMTAMAKTSSIRDQVSAEEWQARVDLAAAYRLVAVYGWDDLIFTHISARAPGGEHHFLLNPYGMMFDEVTASSLVKIDLAGNKVMASPYFINPAGFTIHSAVHAAREDALCVMHLHTDYGVAVSAQKDGLLPISQQAMLALQSLAYHDYEGLALNEEEKPRLVSDLGDKNHLILRNHGLLTVGRTAAEAFLAMFLLERACKIQILAQAGGAQLVEVPDPVVRLVESQVKAVTVGQGAGLTWPGLLRKLDKIDSSYKE
jgi:ribulose-5-phosphate 4-epimerase/fuculose-1-phosphate aldolase